MNIQYPTKILVQRRSAIGDVIMSTAVVRELNHRYGDNAVIDIATDCFEVYRNNPRVRNIIPTDSADPKAYDIYVNLDDAYELNPKNHYIDSYLFRAFGHNDVSRQVELFPSKEDHEVIEQDIKNIGHRYIVIHMRNWHWAAKNITMETWFAVFEKLFTRRTDFRIVTVGGATDHTVDHPLFFDARDRYNCQQQKLLCDRAACFVGIDSAPFHCATASDTHVIGLLTHLHAERIMPSVNSTAIATLEDCAGCNDNQAAPVRQIKCQKGHYPCVNNFDTDRIAHEILQQL